MDELLPRLDAAVAAATTLGLPVAAAARARDDVAQRVATRATCTCGAGGWHG